MRWQEAEEAYITFGRGYFLGCEIDCNKHTDTVTKLAMKKFSQSRPCRLYFWYSLIAGILVA